MSTSPIMHARDLQAPRRLLVTGAAGFVGRHAVEAALRSDGDLEVIACDVRPPGEDACPEGGRLRFAALDVRDPAACERLLRETRPTHVLHAAAITAGADRQVIAVNAQGSETLLGAAVKVGSVERCVLLSSSAVYGDGRGGRPCDECHPLQLVSAYARSKRVAELCLPELERTSGIPMIAVRLGPCYGPAESAGPFRPGMSLVGRLMEAHRRGERLCVGGEDYARDWTDLDQVSEALLLLLGTRGLGHRLYNLSAGQAIAASDLLRCFGEQGLRVEWTDAASAELVLKRSDARKPLVIDRLCQDTGFAPRHDWPHRIAAMLQGTAAMQHIQ